MSRIIFLHACLYWLVLCYGVYLEATGIWSLGARGVMGSDTCIISSNVRWKLALLQLLFILLVLLQSSLSLWTFATIYLYECEVK